jgi:fructose-1,6-bisphosphatase II
VGEPIGRNLGFDLVRVTEAAALASARWMGRGDKNTADGAAVAAMRYAVGSVEMDGVVVIGEGLKDQAPMLYIGERVGTGTPPQVDVAVDPIDGTRLLSKGLPNALSVIALAERGTLYTTPLAYVNKLAVGYAARAAIDITASVATNLKNIARALHYDVEDLSVVVLDRPRHDTLIGEIRKAGARIRLISDGDVAGAVMAAMDDTGVDVLMGVGGAPEAVVAAVALRCLGGEIQCQLWPKDEAERKLVYEQKLDVNRVLTTEDLVRSDDVFFAATGITDGELLRGVRYSARGARTQSLVMRGHSGTVRFVDATHDLHKLQRISSVQY